VRKLCAMLGRAHGAQKHRSAFKNGILRWLCLQLEYDSRFVNPRVLQIVRKAKNMNGDPTFGSPFVFHLSCPGLFVRLLHFPGVAGAEELREVAWAALGDDVLNLLGHHVLVAVAVP
jgi:hypothetical protein